MLRTDGPGRRLTGDRAPAGRRLTGDRAPAAPSTISVLQVGTYTTVCPRSLDPFYIVSYYLILMLVDS